MPIATAQEVYLQNVRALPASERLRLAALILGDLTQPEEETATSIDYSDEWTKEDTDDLTAFSLSYAAAQYPDEQDWAEVRARVKVALTPLNDLPDV